nr:glycoside hydrolase family 47 protein [Jatrophihabitans endophyticus]
MHAWNGYKRFAFGYDQVMPISEKPNNFFFEDRSVGLSIVEALDTLYVMGLDDELRIGLDWIHANLNFDIDENDFGIFEGIIRLVGGLLAGYLAVRDVRLLQLAQDLADRIMPVFEKSPTGIPYGRVNLATGAVSSADTVLAEAGTNLLEFGTLSRLTGNPRYYRAAKRAQRAVFDRRSSLDLLGTTINVETGQWTDPTDEAVNPPTDSFYEYLWGGYALFGDLECLRFYRTLSAALGRYVAERYDGLLWYRQVDFRTGALLGRRQSELASFWAELVSAGGDPATGESYYRSWTTVLERYRVLPEEIDYTTLAATSVSNQFRPEYVNSSFDLYWQTGDAAYEETAYAYFAGLRDNARTRHGYTIIDDVTTTPMLQGDLFPAYGFAENFKYLYLIFARTPRFDTRSFFLSTEGKVLRGLRPDPRFRP